MDEYGNTTPEMQYVRRVLESEFGPCEAVDRVMVVLEMREREQRAATEARRETDRAVAEKEQEKKLTLGDD